MTQDLQNVANKTTPIKLSVYNEFVLWTAMPYVEKDKLGLETQAQFAEYYKVNAATLTRWKQRPDFEQRVDAILKMWATDKTPDVVHSIYRTAVKGNPMSQMLWLQYFKGFNPKKNETDENQQRSGGGVGDLKHLVDQLPEQMREKHYGYIRELLADISAFRNARDVESDDWHARPAQPVLDETNNDASGVSSQRADAIPRSYKKGICTDMEWQVSTHNHKSAAWGWEK